MAASTPPGAFFDVIPYAALKPSHLEDSEPRKPTPNATIERLKRAVRDNPTPNRQR